jgi:hypothetical protein
MKSLNKKGFNELKEVIKALERMEAVSDKDAVREMASLLARVDREHVESLLRIVRMDFGEASRLFGTNLIKRVVSEAMASIAPLKQSEAEELLEAGRIGEVLRRRSRVLTERGVSINQAYLGIVDACGISGKSSIGSKAKALANLLNKASIEEAVFIINLLTGKGRRVSDELVLKAVAEAFQVSPDDVKSLDVYEAVKQGIGKSE